MKVDREGPSLNCTQSTTIQSTFGTGEYSDILYIRLYTHATRITLALVWATRRRRFSREYTIHK